MARLRQPAAERLRHRIELALLLLALVAAGAWFAWHEQEPGMAEPNVPTLVVLALHAAGARHDEGVLAEGISEELGAQFASIEGLRGIASTSAQRAASEHLDGARLARRVGVSLVLEGELRESGGDQVHLDLRLFRAPDGRTLWTHAYDRSLAAANALEREIAQDVAAALKLRLDARQPWHGEVDPRSYRDYLEARRLLVGPQHARGLDLMRALVLRAPDYARPHATLARSLTGDVRAGAGIHNDLDEAARAAARALELDPDLSEAQIASAVLACRAADWGRCLEAFRGALALDPNDAEARNTYAYWLAALGYVDHALHEAQTAWRYDPLSYNANFSYARLLDTAGRHEEAMHHLDALSSESGGLIYARWHNAVWRHDFKTAAQLTAAMPRSDGFRESYIVVTEALAEPRLWPQVLPLISTSERANGGINVQRIMMPNPDYAVVLSGLEKMLRDGWPSYYMLLWMPEYAAMRRDPSFQDFLLRTHLLEFWRSAGWPPQCHAADDGAAVCT